MVRLNHTHYSLLKKKKKKKNFQNRPIKSNSSELGRFRAIRPHSPQIRQNSHILLTFSIMFQVPAPAENPGKLQRITQIPRNSPTQSANLAKFAHFANLFNYVSGTCSGREPWKITANYADSARFAHTVRESREFRTLRTIIKTYLVHFQISDHRQRTQENWSESTRFRSIRPLITQIMRMPRISQ